MYHIKIHKYIDFEIFFEQFIFNKSFEKYWQLNI